ncbi:uncharacterized [Tachysurus ichikawai]
MYPATPCCSPFTAAPTQQPSQLMLLCLSAFVSVALRWKAVIAVGTIASLQRHVCSSLFPHTCQASSPHLSSLTSGSPDDSGSW